MTGNPLTIDRRGQGDLFLFDVVSAPIKDLIDTMEHPFYSLSKRPETAVRVYRHGDVGVELIPSRKGLPTIYDKDLLIYAVSKVAAEKRAGREASAMVAMPSAEILRFTNRGTSGRDYAALEDALERLAGTLIKTTIRAPRGGRDVIMFHLVEIAHMGRRGSLGFTGCTLKLSDWIFEAIEANAILTLHPDYFRLRRPLEKRLYEIARKHCGHQSSFRIGLEKLRNKAGVRAPLRNFRGAVKRVAKTDHLPDYHVHLEEGGQVVAFTNRAVDAAAILADPLPPLDPAALEAARRILPGEDVYAVEAEWRAWAAGKAARPGDADLAFLGFVRRRAS